MRRPTPPRYAVPSGLQVFDGLLGPLWKEDRPAMDGSKQQLRMTAGLDLGDKHSYLCLIDQQSGEIMEEGRLPTTPEALVPGGAQGRRLPGSSGHNPLQAGVDRVSHATGQSRP